jgi:prevent-host-death family protein
MTKVGVDTFKSCLGEYLRLAKAGERIVVTEGGRSVAMLVSLSESAQRAWELVEAGNADWAGGKPTGTRQRPRSRGKSASDIVLEDRR